jgi:hypothetical protein
MAQPIRPETWLELLNEYVGNALEQRRRDKHSPQFSMCACACAFGQPTLRRRAVR